MAKSSATAVHNQAKTATKQAAIPGCRQIRRQLGRGDRIRSSISKNVQGMITGSKNTVMSEHVTRASNVDQL
jgi:hypothetical protein